MRRLTIERTAVITLFVLLFALATRIPVDTDMGWHLRSGAYTLQHGFMRVDPFSFTMQGQPWVNHSWGSQIILYALWQLAGNTGMALYVAALATAGMAVLYRLCVGNAYLRSFAIILGAATAAVFWSPRPQMISFFLSTVVLYLLYLYKVKRIDRLWLLPPLMALWGNLHAGFSIGFLFIAAAVAGESLANLFNRGGEGVLGWRAVGRLALIGILSAAALVVNPYGLQMLAVPFQTLGIGALQNHIQEWNSPNFHQVEMLPFVALLFGLLAVSAAASRRLRWTELILVCGTAFMALLAGRNVAVFAVAATPIFTRELDSLLADRGLSFHPARFATPIQARLNLVLIVVIVLAALAKIVVVLRPAAVAEAQAQTLPVAAVTYLNQTRPAGPLFNSYNWGGYLIQNAPEYPVFVDGRTDLYGDAFLTRYLKTATGAKGWRDEFARYGINLALIEANGGLADDLRVEPGWKVAYEDKLAAVFVKGQS